MHVKENTIEPSGVFLDILLFLKYYGSR